MQIKLIFCKLVQKGCFPFKGGAKVLQLTMWEQTSTLEHCTKSHWLNI